MILGFGIDLCDIRRIEDSLTRFGDRFVNRCFTEIERQKSEGRASPAASYAKRFAAKEACAKALGTGIAAGVFWRDMGVVNLMSGKPTLCLTGGAALRLAKMTPMGHIAVIHLTLTDEYPMAQAQVIIEAVAGELAIMEKPRSLPTSTPVDL
ncbi:holo-ACP synthase [Methyloferula stellata]|uniref:holo-ACP synthase n=1 Tax=Methyloferula stellata TaxID=876270 RepID=UPI000367CCF2|nr:holo-ACP synthase [Methyloferula stellata]